MKKTICGLIMICQLLLLNSCDGDIDTHRPYGANDGKVPGVVKIDSYDQIPGGVRLKFTAPADEDLMYIKIKYTLDNGQKMEARASLYSNETIIEGFGNVNSKRLVISAVDRLDNEGEAVTTDVIPGMPACIVAYEALDTESTFGGIFIRTVNEHRNNIILDISTTDEDGVWYIVHTEYTSVSNIRFPIRGFDSEPREFRITIRDIWGNSSETYTTTVTPMYEELLDLTKFRGLVLPGDLRVDLYGPMENLFNGNNRWNEFNLGHSPDFNPDQFPVWFTFDMGQQANISRYIYWQRLMSNGEYLYNAGSIKEWELWGRPDLPDASGSWDGWTKLMDCESIKPSGWPTGSTSEEDVAWARKGEEFELPMDAPTVRYIRLKIFSTHTGSGSVVMQQIWFYGMPAE